jgi:integrase
MTESLEQWLLSFESGKTWLQKLNSPETKRVYVSSLKKYCIAVKKTPDSLIALKVQGLKHTGDSKEFQAEKLLENYLFSVKLTDSIKEQIKASVMSFYKNNWRALNNQTAQNIGKPTPKQRTPTSKDLEKLESKMTSQRDRALIWFLASSGVRVGTLNKLTWQDLKPTQDSEIPYKMIIEAERLKGHGKGRYKGLKQICFIHRLAAGKLEEYKIEAKTKGYNFKLQDPIFIRYSNEGKIQAMKNALMDKVFTVASLTLWNDLEKKRFSPQDTFLTPQLKSKLQKFNVSKLR